MYEIISKIFLADVLFLGGHLGLETFCIRVHTVYVMEVVMELTTRVCEVYFFWTTLV